MKYNSLIIGCGKIAGIFDNEKTISFILMLKHIKKIKILTRYFFVIFNMIKLKNLELNINLTFMILTINILNDFHPDLISVCTPSDTHFEICKKF